MQEGKIEDARCTIFPSPWKGEGQGGGDIYFMNPHHNPPPRIRRGRNYFLDPQSS